MLPEVVLAAHDAQLAEHGGLTGIRDEGALDSALARPHYGEENLFILATMYASGIVKNHPFADGNKRTGFLAAFIFLTVNGYMLQASEAEVVLITEGLASSEIDEAGFARWLEDNTTTA